MKTTTIAAQSETEVDHKRTSRGRLIHELYNFRDAVERFVTKVSNSQQEVSIILSHVLKEFRSEFVRNIQIYNGIKRRTHNCILTTTHAYNNGNFNDSTIRNDIGRNLKI